MHTKPPFQLIRSSVSNETGQAQNLAMGQAGTGRGTGQSLFIPTFPVLQCTFPVLERSVFGFFWESDFVSGRPGTEEFAGGFLLLPLSRDKGTAGQRNIFVPGKRDNGTSRPLETLMKRHCV